MGHFNSWRRDEGCASPVDWTVVSVPSTEMKTLGIEAQAGIVDTNLRRKNFAGLAEMWENTNSLTL